MLKDEAQSAQAQQKKLYWWKHQLVFEKLSKWQQIQSHKIVSNTENEAPQVASLLSYFNWIYHLNLLCDQLTSLLFLNISLHSVQSCSALQNMITLCKENLWVVYCSSLWPENDHCSVPQCVRKFLKCLIVVNWLINHSLILQHQYWQ